MVFRNGHISLEVEISGESRRIFFINDVFTFEDLKQSIEFECPRVSVDLDFTRMGDTLFDESSTLVSFLRHTKAGSLILNIDEQQYVLRNATSNPLAEIINQMQ